MKVNLVAAITDGWDGSYGIKLFNTREEALKDLDRTEEQIEQGNFYEDGDIKEITLELTKDGKLIKPISISVG